MRRLRSKGEAGRIPLFLFLLSLPWMVAGAQTDADTTISNPSAGKTPAGAVLRSLVLPGWGQWYNQQKLKAVIVFAGEAALAGNIIYYDQKAKKSTDLFEKGFYEDYRSQFIWYLVGAHLLSLLDAYVDANLLDFDTGPDLTTVEYPIVESPTTWSLSLRLPIDRSRDYRDRVQQNRIERIRVRLQYLSDASGSNGPIITDHKTDEISQIVEDEHDKR